MLRQVGTARRGQISLAETQPEWSYLSVQPAKSKLLSLWRAIMKKPQAAVRSRLRKQASRQEGSEKRVLSSSQVKPSTAAETQPRSWPFGRTY